jgi:hypothetical protein
MAEQFSSRRIDVIEKPHFFYFFFISKHKNILVQVNNLTFEGEWASFNNVLGLKYESGPRKHVFFLLDPPLRRTGLVHFSRAFNPTVLSPRVDLIFFPFPFFFFFLSSRETNGYCFSSLSGQIRRESKRIRLLRSVIYRCVLHQLTLISKMDFGKGNRCEFKKWTFTTRRSTKPSTE